MIPHVYSLAILDPVFLNSAHSILSETHPKAFSSSFVIEIHSRFPSGGRLPAPLKYEFVSWDDPCYFQDLEKENIFQSTMRPLYLYGLASSIGFL